MHDIILDGVGLVRLENAHLRLDVAPSVGGRVVSLYDKRAAHELLWRNRNLTLRRLAPGSAYDPNFYGGIDELLPNDLPETLMGSALPDHGELWTCRLQHRIDHSSQTLDLSATLPISKLHYARRMQLNPKAPEVWLDYRIENQLDRAQHFMFKLHAALDIAPGDRIVCPARKAQVADPAYARWSNTAPVDWPITDDKGRRADVVPTCDGSMDFLYLYELAAGEIGWTRPGTPLGFRYRFDPKVFPCAWVFASYGGFLGHQTVVLEPCTTMPMSVAEAAHSGVCAHLAPGEVLQTRVSILIGGL